MLGVEGVPFVVEQFFRENNVDHEKTKMEEINGWKYKVLRFCQPLCEDEVPLWITLPILTQ